MGDKGNVTLRKVKVGDKKYFSRWWRGKVLLKFTSGDTRKISDKELSEYFTGLLNDQKSNHFLILLGKKVIGHIALIHRKNRWHETQIIIGEKTYWGKGYGTQAIRKMVVQAKRRRISKIYLEVRPENIRAIRAYEKAGFVKVGVKKHPHNKYLPQTLKMVFSRNYE